MTIHKRIKERREALRLSMQELATASGVSAWQTVQQWEKEDGTAPKRQRLKAVADALGVSPEWLMTGREPGQRSDALQFTELNGLEAQLVMLSRAMSDDDKYDLLIKANEMVNRSSSGEPGPANPFPGIEKQSSKNIAKKK